MEFLTVLPIAISLTAVTLSGVFGYLTFVDRREAARLGREADLHAWVQQLAGIYAAIRTQTGPERAAALVRLSLQIDYGRLLFPNDTSKEATSHNPRGWRSSILDPLIETHRRVEKGEMSDDKIAQDWREFVNQLRARTTAFQINTSPEASGHIQYENP